MHVTPLPDSVLVDKFKKGERLIGSIIILNDDGKSSGVRARWGRVYAVGTDIKDVSPGEWILVEHGRWTRGAKVPEIENKDNPDEVSTLWKIDAKCILAVSEEEPEDNLFSKN